MTPQHSSTVQHTQGTPLQRLLHRRPDIQCDTSSKTACMCWVSLQQYCPTPNTQNSSASLQQGVCVEFADTPVVTAATTQGLPNSDWLLPP